MKLLDPLLSLFGIKGTRSVKDFDAALELRTRALDDARTKAVNLNAILEERLDVIAEALEFRNNEIAALHKILAEKEAQIQPMTRRIKELTEALEDEGKA
jgi:uncharacterized coiled-coil protein SlyX